MPNALRSIIVKERVGVHEEWVANAAISPGHLVEIMSTNKVRVHATANHLAERMFALEDELQGNGVDDAYAAADVVQVGIFRSGDVVNAILADGESVAIGDKLSSNGDGTLKKWAMATGDSSDLLEANADDLVNFAVAAIGVSEEALDLSSSSAEESSGLIGDRRIKVRIL